MTILDDRPVRQVRSPGPPQHRVVWAAPPLPRLHQRLPGRRWSGLKTVLTVVVFVVCTVAAVVVAVRAPTVSPVAPTTPTATAAVAPPAVGVPAPGPGPGLVDLGGDLGGPGGRFGGGGRRR